MVKKVKGGKGKRRNTKTVTVKGTKKNEVKAKGITYNQDVLKQIRFSPYAWAQYLYLRDKGTSEVSMFGVTAEDHLNIVEYLTMVKQTCHATTTDMDDEALAEYMDNMDQAGIPPKRCMRVWLHTHPGSSAVPSGKDEDTFRDSFGFSPWAVMGILAKGGQTYARISCNIGEGRIQQELKMVVDWSLPFLGANHALWDRMYDQCVTIETPGTYTQSWNNSSYTDTSLYKSPDDSHRGIWYGGYMQHYHSMKGIYGRWVGKTFIACDGLNKQKGLPKFKDKVEPTIVTPNTSLQLVGDTEYNDDEFTAAFDQAALDSSEGEILIPSGETVVITPRPAGSVPLLPENSVLGKARRRK